MLVEEKFHSTRQVIYKSLSLYFINTVTIIIDSSPSFMYLICKDIASRLNLFNATSSIKLKNKAAIILR